MFQLGYQAVAGFGVEGVLDCPPPSENGFKGNVPFFEHFFYYFEVVSFRNEHFILFVFFGGSKKLVV